MKKSQLRQIIKEEISRVLKENSVNESMAVNTSTGEDITGHLIDYMEGKITREEFEKLTGLTNLSTPMPSHMTDPSNSRY